jgi:hypothetical protein
MADDKFHQDVAAVEQAGKARYGDRWQAAIDAIGRSTGPAGIPEGNMREILAQPDPAQLLYIAGKEALLQQSDKGDHEAERIYRQMRADERDAYRKNRNR